MYANREVSVLVNEIPEESGQFRLLRVACSDYIQGLSKQTTGRKRNWPDSSGLQQIKKGWSPRVKSVTLKTMKSKKNR